MSNLLNAAGQPIRRGIPDELLKQVLAQHETQIQAAVAQTIHTGLLLEFVVEKLKTAVPHLELENEEFIEFRQRRMMEMKAQSERVDIDLEEEADE